MAKRTPGGEKHSSPGFLAAIFSLRLIAELGWPEGPPSGAPFSYRKVNEFLVIMDSGIALGRVSTTTSAAESRNMGAILPLISWQRHILRSRSTE